MEKKKKKKEHFKIGVKTYIKPPMVLFLAVILQYIISLSLNTGSSSWVGTTQCEETGTGCVYPGGRGRKGLEVPFRTHSLHSTRHGF